MQHADVGRLVEQALLRRGWPHSFALVAGHLAAVGSAYNYQGCRRIAELMRRHPRTVQRARAALERRGLVRSYLLLTGQHVPGQRPVRHPQVVRDVRKLQQLARVGGSLERLGLSSSQRPKKSDGGSRTDPAPMQDVATPMDPELRASIIAFAASLDPKAPPNAAPPMTPEEIDEVERQRDDAIDRALRDAQYPRSAPASRGPPIRGKPN